MKNDLITFEDGTSVSVTPHPDHIWTQSTELVAKGYKVDPSSIRKNLKRNEEELIEGQHFIRVHNVHSNPKAGIPHQELHWTKLGVATLGFFIRSKRAREYRRKAAELVIEVQETGAALREAPHSPLQAFEAILDAMKNQELKQQELETKVQSIALREEERSGNLDWLTAVGFLTLKGQNADRKSCAVLGRKASSIMKAKGLERGKMRDPRFGEIGTYPSEVLEEAFAK